MSTTIRAPRAFSAMTHLAFPRDATPIYSKVFSVVEFQTMKLTRWPCRASLHLLSPIWGDPLRAPTTPDEAVLDRVPNPHGDKLYVVRFSAPEFTVLCAVTGQPDFAHFTIDYVPGAWLIESKSLKFYLASFRSYSDFHEECTIAIGKRIAAVLEPVYLRIGGYWSPRGEYRSMCSGRPERCRRTCGCLTRASPPTAGAARSSDAIDRAVVAAA
jgi:7-cyano-7-deazaguanine reductase